MIIAKTVTLEQLATYVLTSTALVPGLLAFSIGSRSSLKTWLAAQQAPPAPRLDKDVEKSMKRKMMAVFALTMVTILGLEFYLFAQGDEKTIDRFFAWLFGYIFEISAVSLLVEVTQALQWSFHRGVGNTLHFRPQRISKPRLLFAAGAATALNVGAYFDVHSVCSGALVTAVLVSRLSNAPSRSFSLRGCIFVLVAIVAFLSAISGVAIMMALKLQKDGERVPDEPEYVGFASPDVMKYMNPFIIAIWNILPGSLIAGCFRFDYSNAVDASAESFAPSALESVDAPACKVGYLSSGVLLPLHAPNWFAKPYYTVALWSWLIAQVSAAGLLALALPFPEAILDSGVFTYISVYLSCVFVVTSVVVTAVLRGEAKKMWTYREVWVPKADKGVTLEGGEEEGQDQVRDSFESDELLPAYEARVAPVSDGDSKEAIVSIDATADVKA